MRTPTLGRDVLLVTTENGSVALTQDHKVYVSPTDRVQAQDLRPGSSILKVGETHVEKQRVRSVLTLPRRDWVYNLTVQEYRNFRVENSYAGLQNSPDRNYHFMPPQHEGRIGKFDRVFGQIWEDYELLLYLNRGLDDWHLHPPATDFVRTIDEVWSFYPGWRSGVTWAAITHAMYALMCNWIADEFSVSADTPVKVVLPSGKEIDIPMAELYSVCMEDESKNGERRGD